MILIDADDRTRTSTAVNPPSYSPARDFVEVVRCKDCKHMFTDFVMDGKEYKRCEMQMAGFHDDWFCADGERKDDESHPFADDVMMGERKDE